RCGSGKRPNSSPAGDTEPGDGTARYNGPGTVTDTRHGNSTAQFNDSALRSGATIGNAPVPATRIERKLYIQFLASEAFMKKYEEARSLLSNRHANASFETVFESLIDDFLERRSPQRRQERRQAGRKRRSERSSTNRSATTKVTPKKRTVKIALSKQDTSTVPNATATPLQQGACEKSDYSRSGSGKRPKASLHTQQRSRRIPAAVRDKVFVRDGGRCTYVGTTGTRCGSTHHLHVDHVTPFARGGPSAAGNLRLLCAEHNRLAAEKSFGAEHMKRFRHRE
ncbi:MAG: HNH endonuclease signature motif containing protein, partial [Candidatus Krumholzibacteria bacterium]